MSNTTFDIIKRVRKRFFRYFNPKGLDLTGDREIEWGFVAGHIPDPDNSGIALDFGCGDMPIGLVAALKGYAVIGIDLNQVYWSFIHPAIKFIQGDINSYDFGNQKYDIILNCSTIEHVGLPGRYGSASESGGDFKSHATTFDLIETCWKAIDDGPRRTGSNLSTISPDLWDWTPAAFTGRIGNFVRGVLDQAPW